ncbi:hypothetical protein ACQ4PT_025258 [Festuca glaucescens]
MTWLLKKEVDWILAQAENKDRSPPEVKAMRRLNRDLWPEEDLDSYGPREYIATEEEFSKFQASVRSQYHKQGYVEVDDGFLASRAKVQAWSDEAREKALRSIDFSGHEDLKRFFRKDWP